MKLGVWTVVVVCLLSAVVRGDDESDRKQYIDDIDRLLDGMADDRKGANVILGKLVKTMNSIQNVLNNELKGANDPEVRAQMELGKLEHKRIQADRGKCDESEITIPGASKRIDCVKECTIYEIKPNNSKAIDKGKDQAADYKRAVQEYFEYDKTKMNERFSGKMKVFLSCIKDGQISLNVDVRVYDFCPADGKLFNDFVVE
jgi:hypothetical protein